MREERQALAGLSARARPASRARARISCLVRRAAAKRRDGVVQCGGFLAGAEFDAVVEVHAVGEMGEAEFEAGWLHLGEELVLAVEAAVAVVAGVVGVVQFAGLQDAGGNAVLGGEVERGGQLAAGQRGGVGDDREHAVTECAMGLPGEIGGIGSAGVCDQQRVERTEDLAEHVVSFGQLHMQTHCKGLGRATAICGSCRMKCAGR